MELKNIQRKERKTLKISLRISKKTSEWMKDNNISPQKLFDESVIELMKE